MSKRELWVLMCFASWGFDYVLVMVVHLFCSPKQKKLHGLERKKEEEEEEGCKPIYYQIHNNN